MKLSSFDMSNAEILIKNKTTLIYTNDIIYNNSFVKLAGDENMSLLNDIHTVANAFGLNATQVPVDNNGAKHIKAVEISFHPWCQVDIPFHHAKTERDLLVKLKTRLESMEIGLVYNTYGVISSDPSVEVSLVMEPVFSLALSHDAEVTFNFNHDENKIYYIVHLKSDRDIGTMVNRVNRCCFMAVNDE